jgi:DNA polymerase-3 subunit alpha
LPGPLSLGMDKMMIDAMSKGESFEFQFPKYQHLFKDTYGLFAYQEQLMQLSGEMCGFDAIKQDVLRKATGRTIDFFTKVKESNESLYNYMYYDGCFCLERKKVKFEFCPS